MKKIYTLLILLITTVSFGQVQKLAELSQGSMIGSQIIYDDDEDDIYGYFLLFQIDQHTKDSYTLEYAILDKNLNKVTSKRFKERIYQGFMAESEVKLFFVNKYNNEIVFGLFDDVESNFILPPVEDPRFISDLGNIRYRRINLDDFSISDEVIFLENKATYDPYKNQEKMKFKEFRNHQTITPTETGAYVLFHKSKDIDDIKAFMLPHKYNKLAKGGIKKVSLLNQDFKETWTTTINQNEDDLRAYTNRGSDTDVLVLEKEKFTSNQDDLWAYEIINLQSGEKTGDFKLVDDNYFLKNYMIDFTADHVVFFNYLYDNNKRKKEKELGYSRIVIDKKSGEEISRNNFLWEDLGDHFDVKNKFGKLKKYGNLYFEDFISLENGETIAIAEGYTFKRPNRILDLFVMKFDEDFKLDYFHKVDMIETKLKTKKMYSKYLEQYGLFNYNYSQKLDDDENYVFFYTDNEQEGSRRKRNKKPKFNLGIITYVDGEFDYNKLQLTTENAQTTPVKAKNGSILLQEINEQTGPEMRLEKINY